MTNGVYHTGGINAAGSNRVAVTRPITVSSVNGPSVTMIRGYQTPGTPNDSSAIRCVYLTSGATLSGFTLTNGASFNGGAGGVLCQSTSAVITNCIIIGNPGGGAANGTLFNCLLTENTLGGAGGSILVGCTIVSNSTSGMGGGVTSMCKLTNCIVAGNYANTSGGGCYLSTLVNCTVTGNKAHERGGGTFVCVLVNSIIYYNDVDLITDNSTNHGGTISAINCCTIPLPNGNAINNFSNAPAFSDQAAGGLSSSVLVHLYKRRQ